MNESFEPPTLLRELAQKLAQPLPMRRGSVSVRYQRCHKPGCPCANDPQKRHGPYVSVVRVVQGKTRSRWVPAAKLPLLQRQVATGRQFRQQLEAYWQACEAWADAELSAAAASGEAAKKKASKRPSPRKSSPKSKP